MSSDIVVIGTGQCAGQLAARLRAEGFEGGITLVGEERHAPYQRPPLSKAFLAGEVGLDRVLLRPESFYASRDVTLRLGAAATRIDREARRVELADGEVLPYGRLVLATGSRVRRLAVPGADLAGVHYLRRIEDAEAIRACFGDGARLVVVGGGYIGLEVAAVAAGKGVAVTVLETEPRLMSRVVGPEVAEFYRGVHEAHGVRVLTGTRVSAFEGDGRVREVLCADGSRHPAECVVVGVGIAPAVELAAQAGLEVEGGIVVDEHGRTTDPAIFAAGDCTLHPSRIYARRVRLESVHNAMAQAKAVAAGLAGKETPYDEVPWFWSDQYDLKLQIAGLSQGWDRSVLRGDPAQRAFSVFYLREGRLIAADTVNGLQDHVACRTLVQKRVRASEAQLADPSVSLKALA